MKRHLACTLAVFLAGASPASAQPVTREQAMRAAIHPVATEAGMRQWLARVPVTRNWPPDFAETMKGQGPAFIVEMSTAPGCVPCADLWNRLGALGQRYGWKVRTIGSQEAMLRSAVAEDVVQRPMSEFMSKEVFGAIAERLGHANFKLRGQLAVSLVLGMALSRHILRLPTLTAASDQQIIEGLGGAMQEILVEDW